MLDINKIRNFNNIFEETLRKSLKVSCFLRKFLEICGMKKPVIAIDGYSSTGKSSISKVIAQKLGIIHLDTGALYRGVTWFALQNCLNEDGTINLNELFSSLDQIELEFKNVENELVLFLNHIDISKQIRTNEVSDNVSLVAKQKKLETFTTIPTLIS